MKASGIFKLSTLALLTTAAMGAQAGISADTAQGTFAVSGDVEFDNDYQKTETTTSDYTMIDQSGRLLVGVSGMREASGDRYISTNAQILLKMDGDVAADDAWIAMGKQADWEVKLGRFEAYNLFPAGQDTVLNHADDFKVYTASAARGRSDNGQINLSKTMGSTYFEVSTNFMPASGTADSNAVFLRPVLSVGLGDAFRLSAGAEINATADKLDASNDFTGYGATLNYSADMLSVNLNYATRDFDTNTQEDTSYGVNAQYGNAFVGYVNGVIDTTSEREVNTFYASYKFANIMDVEDLALYLGASTSEVKDEDEKDTSVRLRVKYLF